MEQRFYAFKVMLERNWVLVTNSDFLYTLYLGIGNPMSFYFKLLIMLDQKISVWNIKGLPHQIATIKVLENLTWWEKLSFFKISWFFCKHKLLHCFFIKYLKSNPITDGTWEMFLFHQKNKFIFMIRHPMCTLWYPYIMLASDN